jgi:hypothetical protein
MAEFSFCAFFIIDERVLAAVAEEEAFVVLFKGNGV